MAKVIKVVISGSGYNAFTDTNPDHFALYVNQEVDYVLIKEKLTNTISVPPNDNEVVAHGLGYVPFCLVFVEYESGKWRKLFSRPLDGTGYYFEVTDTNLTMYNDSGTAKNFSYHIFYDEIA